MTAPDIAEPDADSIGRRFAKEHAGGIMGVRPLEEDVAEPEVPTMEGTIMGGGVTYWAAAGDKKHPRILACRAIKADGAIKGGDENPSAVASG